MQKETREKEKGWERLTVSSELEGVPLPDGGVLSTALRLVVAVTLALAPGLLAGGGETTALATLVHRLGDPVDASIASDRLVLRVHSDDFKVLVHTVLVDPVGVEDTQVAALATHTLLGSSTQRTLVLEVVDTLTNRLAVRSTLGHRLLAVTPANANAVHHVSLLSLVTKTVRLVKTRRSRSPVDHIQLAVLPAAVTFQVVIKRTNVVAATVSMLARSWCVLEITQSLLLTQRIFPSTIAICSTKQLAKSC